MPRCGPRGLLTRLSASLASKRSSIWSTRTTPARRKTALYSVSSPAMAPVWLAAASALRAVRPLFTTMIGLLLAKCLAALMNLRASVMDSM